MSASFMNWLEACLDQVGSHGPVEGRLGVPAANFRVGITSQHPGAQARFEPPFAG